MVIRRPRPGVYTTATASSADDVLGFPSGHATLVFASATFFALGPAQHLSGAGRAAAIPLAYTHIFQCVRFSTVPSNATPDPGHVRP